jgi:hypothetical protein
MLGRLTLKRFKESGNAAAMVKSAARRESARTKLTATWGRAHG